MPPRPGYTWHHRRPAIREANRNGATTVAEIAERVGLSPRTTYEHLRRMKRDGEASFHQPDGIRRAARWRVR